MRSPEAWTTLPLQTADAAYRTDLRHILGFRVKGVGFRVKGLGFRVKGVGYRVKGLGFRVKDLGSFDI
jgi:hypothetical protein